VKTLLLSVIVKFVCR